MPPPRYQIFVECATFVETVPIPAAPSGAYSTDNVFTIETITMDGYNLNSIPPRLSVDVGWEWMKSEPWQILMQQPGYRANVAIRDSKKAGGEVKIPCTVENAILIPQTAIADGTTLPERRHIEFATGGVTSLWTPTQLGESLLHVARPVQVGIEVKPCDLDDDEYCQTHRKYHDHEWRVGDRVFVSDVYRSEVTKKVHRLRYYATLARRAQRSWELHFVDIVEGPSDATMKYVEESLLRKVKAVPSFSSPEEAEEWLEANARGAR